MPVNPQLLSREELLTLVAAQAALIEQLRAEVAELRRRLDQNSSNSSRPPSSDSPYGRPKPKSSGMPEREGPRRKGAREYYLVAFGLNVCPASLIREIIGTLVDMRSPERPKAELVLTDDERLELTRWSRRAKSA